MKRFATVFTVALTLLTASCFPEAASASPTCRSYAVKHRFDVQQGYPKGRPGYIVDHTCSLFNHGIDDIRNMQYQTISESKAKDKIENTPYGKRKWCNKTNSTLNREVFNCKRRSSK